MMTLDLRVVVGMQPVVLAMVLPPPAVEPPLRNISVLM
jgi:hypothetical protein